MGDEEVHPRPMKRKESHDDMCANTFLSLQVLL